MQKTEVVQELYTAVTKDNPSSFGGKKLPVDSVSWYDAVKFCNKVSEIQGRTPCYSVNGETDTDKWNNYSPSDVIWNKEQTAGDFLPKKSGLLPQMTVMSIPAATI